MKIQFVSSIKKQENEDLLEYYSVYCLLISNIAEIENKEESEKLSELKPDTRYKITIEEIE